MKDLSFRFTKKAIAELPTPKALTTYHDHATRGLKLVVRPSGTKTFIVYRKINGRPERITLGRFPDLSIEQVRAKADQYNNEIALGKNPAQTKRSVKNETTLAELFELFLQRHSKVHKRSWQQDTKVFQGYCQTLSHHPLSQIKKSDIQKLHSKIGDDSGIYTANRVLALIQSVFNRAIDWGWENANPAKGIKKFKEQSRDRFLQADELSRLFNALEKETNDVIRDYILISLFTGARRSNVLTMRWEQINLNEATWKIPMTKNGESHLLPLVKPALDVLEARKSRSNNEWVFPSHGKTGHLVEPKKTWAQILKRAKIDDLRLHDLRRSLGSWQATTGANLTVIGKTLAHKSVNTTAIYARLNLDPIRDSMDKATQAMLKAGETV